MHVFLAYIVKKSYLCSVFSIFLIRMSTTAKRILNILLIVAAYGYLGYKIATYDNYAGLAAQFSRADIWQWVCVAVCVALFPVNKFFEAWKWQFLVRHFEPMNIWEAQRQVYYGTIAGFITPYKLGEYPGRALLFRHTGNHWLTATCLGMIGGYAMTMVIVMFGLPAAVCWLVPDSSVLWSVLLTVVVAAAAVIVLPGLMRRLQRRSWKSERTRLLVDSIAGLTVRDILVLLGISLLRYGCFLLQLLLMLMACGVWLDAVTYALTLPLYYLLVTVTPNVPAAEVAVRGAWAVAIFERFGSDVTASALVATLLLWAVNTLLPLLVGSVIGGTVTRSHRTGKQSDGK